MCRKRPSKEQDLERVPLFWFGGCLGPFIVPKRFSRRQPL